VLFTIGILFVGFWPANILIIAGICFFVSPFFIRWDVVVLQILLFAVVLMSTVLGNLEIPIYPSFSGIGIADANAMHILGFLFFNGYYSVLPWISFFILGIIFGKSYSKVRGWFPPNSALGLVLLLAGVFTQPFLNNLNGEIAPLDVFSINIFGARFHSFSFFLFESGAIFILVNAVNYFSKKWNETVFGAKAIHVMDKFSSSKYTLYLFVLLQTALMWSVMKGGNQVKIHWFRPIFILVPTSLAMLAASFFLVLWWKKKVTDKAPVEWLLKNISGSRK
jgi:hypothetical protein